MEVVYMSDKDIEKTKPKSFRIDEQTHEKFREISNAIGGNQQETLAKLIEAYEFQSGKSVLTDKKEDIAKFEKYISIITRQYMSSLEENQNLTETIKSQFEALLQSKDTTIQNLQKNLAEAEKIKEKAVADFKVYSNENINLKNEIERLKNEYNSKINDLHNNLEDKNNLNKILTDSCNSMKLKIQGFDQEHQNYLKMTEDFSKLKTDYNSLSEEKRALQLELKKINEQNQIELDKATLGLEKTFREQIKQIEAESQSEIDKYKQQYFILFEKFQEFTNKINVVNKQN